jgi:hypothetical protein
LGQSGTIHSNFDAHRNHLGFVNFHLCRNGNISNAALNARNCYFSQITCQKTALLAFAFGTQGPHCFT